VQISQKCQYALRAVFELARRVGEGPVRIADIAEAQAIPLRFLEVILSQLKQGDFVQSQRGVRGGYVLTRPARDLSVGDIIRFVEGPLGPVECVRGGDHTDCPLHGDCVFLSMWRKVGEALAAVYDGTTFEDLVEEDARRRSAYVQDYSI
jgi:Rrf2 family protein